MGRGGVLKSFECLISSPLPVLRGEEIDDRECFQQSNLEVCATCILQEG
jgi:hypothetical protein